MNEKTRTSGVVPPEVALGFDGLTLLKGMIAGEYPPPPIAETLGFGLVEAEPGRAVFEGRRGSATTIRSASCTAALR
ncbi:MAG: hypothetical protein M5U07_24335 [Xanthobacteraceae bacterium]|nr:hypothetical protein [Xanthobacteraceae bacterium]